MASKDKLLEQAANDPVAMMALMSSGAITSEEVASYKNEQALIEAQQEIHLLEQQEQFKSTSIIVVILIFFVWVIKKRN